jgi:hypothetical protein
MSHHGVYPTSSIRPHSTRPDARLTWLYGSDGQAYPYYAIDGMYEPAIQTMSHTGVWSNGYVTRGQNAHNNVYEFGYCSRSLSQWNC